MDEPAAGVFVRPMRPADWPETINMWVAAWQAAYPEIDFEARRAWAVEHFAALERSGSSSLVALRDGYIVGMLLVDPATGYLDQIVVARDQQGCGVADMLLAQARRLSPAGLDLHVNQDNARAIAFYKKHGFAVTGEDVNSRSGAPTYQMGWRPPPV